MTDINLNAGASRGSVPTAQVTARVEKDGENIYLSVPRTEGVLAAQSAVDLADALYDAAGLFKAEPLNSDEGIPSGWTLKPNGTSFDVYDSNGVHMGSFEQTTVYRSI